MKRKWYALMMCFFVCSTTCFASNENVSVSSSGSLGNGNSFGTSINSTGRYVVFTSSASNLVENDTNGHTDVFIRDRDLGTTERISINSDEEQAMSGDSSLGFVNSDGRYVVFMSKANNLVPNDTNNCVDIFVRDRLLGNTTRVSLDEQGNQFYNLSSFWNTTISADGRYVAFSTYTLWDKVYYRDMFTNITYKIADGGYPRDSIVSGNGRYILFATTAAYDAIDTNGTLDIYVYDIEEPDASKKYKLISKSADNIVGNDQTWIGFSISYDGRFIAFTSRATNLTENPPPGPYSYSLYVRDTVKNITELALLGGAVNTDISADGRYLACTGTSVIDRKDGTITTTSVPDGGGVYPFGAGSPLISDDGRVMSFSAYPSSAQASQVYISGQEDYMCP